MKQIKLNSKLIKKLIVKLNDFSSCEIKPYYVTKESKRSVLLRRLFNKFMNSMKPNALYGLGFSTVENNFNNSIYKSNDPYLFKRKESIIYFHTIHVVCDMNDIIITYYDILTGLVQYIRFPIDHLKGLVLYDCSDMKKTFAKLLKSSITMTNNIDKEDKERDKEETVRVTFFNEQYDNKRQHKQIEKMYKALTKAEKQKIWESTKQGKEEKKYKELYDSLLRFFEEG